MTRWGKKFVCVLMTAILAVFLFIQPVMARSGCCSWHGGVCGCGCCDGSPLSSTCAPYYPECNGGSSTQPPSIPKTEPTPTPTKKLILTPTPKPTATPILRLTPTTIPTPTPTLEPTPTSILEPTEVLSSTPTPKVLGEKTKETEGGSGWLVLFLLLPLAVGSFLLIKGRVKHQ